MSTDNKILHGFYSKRAAELFGSVLYKQGNDIVEVTAIYRDKEGKDYGWEDKVYIGIVDSYYGKGDEGKSFKKGYIREIRPKLLMVTQFLNSLPKNLLILNFVTVVLGMEK